MKTVNNQRRQLVYLEKGILLLLRQSLYFHPRECQKYQRTRFCTGKQNSHRHKINGHRPYWWPAVASQLIPVTHLECNLSLSSAPQSLSTQSSGIFSHFLTEQWKKPILCFPTPKIWSPNHYQKLSNKLSFQIPFSLPTDHLALWELSLHFWHYLSHFPTLLMIIKIQCWLQSWGREKKSHCCCNYN